MRQTVLGVLVAILVVLSVLSPVFASTEPGHTADCAYQVAQACNGTGACAARPAGHVAGETACGYVVPTLASACDLTTGQCGAVAPGHVAGETACGYVEGVFAQPCDLSGKCAGKLAGHIPTGFTCSYVPATEPIECFRLGTCAPLNILHAFTNPSAEPNCPRVLAGLALYDDGVIPEIPCDLSGTCAGVPVGHVAGETACGFKAFVAPVPCDLSGACAGKPAGHVAGATVCGFATADPGNPCDLSGVCAGKAAGHVPGETACGYKVAIACDKNCLAADVVLYRHRIPVSFKPERDSARAPNNTRFMFDYTLGKDSNYAGTSFVSGGFGGGGYYNGGFGGRRAPGSYYGRGYDVRNGVASGYIEVIAEPGNYVLTVSRVALRGYTINPASITIRFTILENGRIRFNTNATRADFTYKRDDVAKKPAHNNPKTGDATNVALWSSMAVTSLAGVVVALKKRMFR